jgi:hypothetical protein
MFIGSGVTRIFCPFQPARDTPDAFRPDPNSIRLSPRDATYSWAVSPVRLYLLGQPVIERDSQPIELTVPRQQEWDTNVSPPLPLHFDLLPRRLLEQRLGQRTIACKLAVQW